MAALTKEAILAAANPKELAREEVDVPSLGGTVIVREMTGTERDDYEATIMTRRGGGRLVVNTENFRARLLVRCIVNESGERLFADGDADALGMLGASKIGRLYEIASRLNVITPQDMEELKKNSGLVDGSDSPTASPADSEG